MALVFGHNEFDVERIGCSVKIADDNVAKLMYYLSCVCNAIECDQDEDIRRFTNYSNWYHLSTDEKKLLLVMCYTFSPDVFDGKVFFHSDELCQGSANEFYKISQVRQRLIAVESIIIAGRTHQVTKIMTYTMPWMRTYYFEPMQRLARQLANYSERPQITSSQYRRSMPSPPVTNNDCCCVIS
ncbi:hypothetical protein I4U23_011694 [Adineta vaga]|nr:hypothetical protein I4U23_011694 [Adineta vaga]